MRQPTTATLVLYRSQWFQWPIAFRNVRHPSTLPHDAHTGNDGRNPNRTRSPGAPGRRSDAAVSRGGTVGGAEEGVGDSEVEDAGVGAGLLPFYRDRDAVGSGF